jgi:aspartyl/asparaginyl-tRNA synthetase
VQEHKEWCCGVSQFSQITLAHKETLSVTWLFRIGMRLYVAGWVRTHSLTKRLNFLLSDSSLFLQAISEVCISSGDNGTRTTVLSL